MNERAVKFESLSILSKYKNCRNTQKICESDILYRFIHKNNIFKVAIYLLFFENNIQISQQSKKKQNKVTIFLLCGQAQKSIEGKKETYIISQFHKYKIIYDILKK